jgi:hypothetical protein
VTDELDDEARERAADVREKRHDRTDPEGRIRRVRAQNDPPEDLGLEDVSLGGDGGPDLPAPVETEFEEIRKKLTYGLDQEFGLELDAEAHYWPLVVHLGVERLKAMWLAEVRQALADVEGVEPPE